MSEVTQFQERRNQLIARVKQYHDMSRGAIVIPAGMERPSSSVTFRQDPTFYYLTGVHEPACVCLIWLSGATELYVPVYPEFRQRWVQSDITEASDPHAYGCDVIAPAGKKQAGISVSPVYDASVYAHVIERLQDACADHVPLCGCMPNNSHAYVEQQEFLQRLTRQMSVSVSWHDISPCVSQLRRKKSRHEVATIYEAAHATVMAQEAAACAIEPDRPENEVQAAAEYIFTEGMAAPAFPTIVAGGERSTILHYQANNGTLADGDLAIVDCGARKDGYAADVTRTYPVNGTFTDKQAQVYEAVRDTQAYIAELLAPGYYVYNADKPELSLYHLAQKRLDQHGYKEYFVHNIGHFLGLDVHDVGSLTTPLQEGDVITIEPGVYDAEHHIGVRIEDDYWIVGDSSVCLTESLPTQRDEIERLVQRTFADLSEEQ